ncbi:unnamed protein product [Allacma fusca]|uniref:Cysteine-rich motor neuron 1 protein n=1 Tax=Allacma fusca TaxID=39272 RepID=A0A8J2L261_9HEXA|nr:unnamed protein product [Allacma fusca]
MCGCGREVNGLETCDCSRVKCPKIEECPPDSYRLPTSVHQESNDCCPTLEKCQCSPGHLCPKPECPTGWIEKLILNATGEPGNCCPLLECNPNQSEESSICSYGGEEYEPGEAWTHHEDCSKCSCSSAGVVTCQKIQCDIPKECRVAWASSDSCCPECVGCITSAGKVYNNSDIWEEDACTLCECVEGRIKCHAAMCRVQCENPIHIPGECCPRCEPEFHGCSSLTCRDLACPYGFKLDNKGCPTCQCNKCPPLLRVNCLLSCPLGFNTDLLGCPVCSCRVSSGILETEMGRSGGGSIPGETSNQLSSSSLLKFRQTNNDGRVEARNVVNGTTVGVGKSCKSVDDKLGVTLRAEGDEWSDGCYHCVCKFGLEMCSLITCSPPDCEQPVFYPGECCPRCPGQDVLTGRDAKILQVNETLCSPSPTDPWNLTDCVTCTCHRGLTFCSAPHCPPAPCANPVSSGCCSICPENTTDTKSIEQHQGINHNCSLDDPRMEYLHGDTWKVGPCKSCRCHYGEIECFSSSGSCPRLTCDRPVQARNQCCPICLDEGEEKWTKMNCSLIGSNDTWSHGQSWTVDKCTRCVCHAPLVQCTRVVCSISCKKSLIYDEDKCCPICPADHHEVLVDGKLTSDLHKKQAGLEPYCAFLITVLLATTSVLAFFLFRVVYRRRRRRRLNDKSLSSSSSSSCTNREYCYFNNNRKNECSTGFTSSSSSNSEGSAPEKKLLCPPNV